MKGDKQGLVIFGAFLGAMTVGIPMSIDHIENYWALFFWFGFMGLIIYAFDKDNA